MVRRPLSPTRQNPANPQGKNPEKPNQPTMSTETEAAEVTSRRKISTAAPVGAAELVAPLAGSMPQPTNAAPPADQASGPADPAITRQFKDKRGTLFDPAKHKADENGRPLRNKNGLFYPKDLGRPTEPEKPSDRPPPTFSEGAGAPLGALPPAPDQYDALADLYLASAYGPMIVVFSLDIKPNEEEHAALKAPLAAWLRIRKAEDISPGWAFAMTAGAVFMKKLDKPTVRERCQFIVLRAKQIFAKMFNRGRAEIRVGEA